jgi:hypothetical protein
MRRLYGGHTKHISELAEELCEDFSQGGVRVAQFLLVHGCDETANSQPARHESQSPKVNRHGL